MHADRVLEFEAIRAMLSGHCETSLGADLAGALNASFEPVEVDELLASTREAHELLGSAALPSLGAVRDLRESVRKAAKGGVMGGIELFQVADALRAMRAFREAVLVRRGEFPRFGEQCALLPVDQGLEMALTDALEPTGEVKDRASEHLASLRKRKTVTQGKLQEKVQSYTSGKTRELLSDPIVTVRDGRYVVPLRAEYRGRIKGIVHDTSASGQTIFIEPEDVLHLGNLLREIEAAEREEVQRILQSLSAMVGGASREIVVGIEVAGRLDLILAKARLAFAMRGVAPERLPIARIEIEAGRHPLLDPEIVVPIDLRVGVGASVLITGPNTGGKTVAIKLVGLCVLMAQSGLFPPARQIKLGPFSQVWADIGDEQSLQQSLSTFSAHVKNIAEALQGMKEGALVLLDEVGAGTDPAEGAALAKAILLTATERGAAILASTHYGELKAFAFETKGFTNAAMEFDSKSLQPTYRVLEGAAGASHALKIAARHGISKPIIDLATESLSSEHQSMSKALLHIDEVQRQARTAQSEADRRLNEAKRAEAAAEAKLKEADEIRRKAHREATEAVEASLRALREEADRVLSALKHSAVSQAQVDEARHQLKSIQAKGSQLSQELSPKASATKSEISKGMTVRIDGVGQSGVVLENPVGGDVLVQVGVMRMTIARNRVSPIERPVEMRKPRTNVRLAKAQTATTEIHLRAKRAEEAQRELEQFLDDALLAGLPSVRIIHGKGDGILRKMAREVLRTNPNVASFRDGESGEGGYGATVAVFK